MGVLDFFFAWYNLPFVAAILFCLLLSILQIVGGVDGDGDTDLDIDADVDGGFDIGDMLGLLGVGHVPLLMVITALLGSFGVLGLLANTLLANLLGAYPSIGFLPVLFSVLVLAFLVTSQISRLIGRLLPESSTAIGFEQLVGRVGVVVSHSVSPTYGRVQVKDAFGSLHTVFAVIKEGDPLPERTEVALLSYDPGQRCFFVRAMAHSQR